MVGVAAGITMLLHVMAGHAAGPSPLRSVNLLVQWLHLLAVGAWIGGLVWLLAGLRGRERPEQVASAVRFSKLAAPVLGLVAVTGLSRALHLAGGWQGLLDSSYGRFLDVKVALFAALVLLGALNRFRVVPALAAGVRRLDHLRRNVRGEVILAACILAVTAVLSQLPPGKFVVEQASAKPPAPPSVQVEGSDFATSVRIALTATPGTAGPNSFSAKVTDYDSGEDWPATRVALRFTLRGQPEVGTSTLELTKAGDGRWTGQGSQLSIAGSWVVVGLVEGSGPAVTVPLELETRTAPQPVKVSEVPGQPTLYTITLAAGGTLQGYIDPGRTGPNTVHFTFFNPSGDEQPTTKARATMTTRSGGPEALTLIRLGPGHFAANVDLEPGRVSFAIDATAGQVQARRPVRAAHRVEEHHDATPTPSPPGRRPARRPGPGCRRLLRGRRRRWAGRAGHHGRRGRRPSQQPGQAHHRDPTPGPDRRPGPCPADPRPRRRQDHQPDHHPHPGRRGPHPPPRRRQAGRHELRPPPAPPPAPPGQHVVQVEFVAADHAPFDPRVLTQAAFQVAG